MTVPADDAPITNGIESFLPPACNPGSVEEMEATFQR